MSGAADSRAGARARLGPVLGWVLFDFAAQPFFTLVTVFIFAPYFASKVVGDTVQGQAIWGYNTAFAGLVISLLAPVLGAVADASGPRKGWVAGFSAMLVGGATALWWCRPGDPIAIPVGLIAYAVAIIGVECATAFTNAMMTDIVRGSGLGRLSGIGVAVGNVGGLLSLAVALGLLVADPVTGLTLFGSPPAFGLDPAAHEGTRAIGPFVALWYLVFVLPLFLLVPDLPVRNSIAGAVAKGLAEVKAMLRLAGSEPNALRFLLANMVYTDGLIALSLFGGIYAVGIFGWTSVELALAGVLVTVSTTVGAFACGFFDDRFGSKPTIIGGLVMLLVAGVLIVSIAPDRIGFVIPMPVGEGEGLFAAPVERIYLGLTVAIGLGAGTLQSASRALMARLSPAAKMTEYFGLFALSGRATIFVGPLLVGLVTSLSDSQRAGISLILVFFALGLVLLRPVRAG